MYSHKIQYIYKIEKTVKDSVAGNHFALKISTKILSTAKYKP